MSGKARGAGYNSIAAHTGASQLPSTMRNDSPDGPSMDTNLDLAVVPLAAPTPVRLADAPRLPDVLRDNLDVVFVGTAAGRRSAELGVYYAHSGNYFWRTLWQSG